MKLKASLQDGDKVQKIEIDGDPLDIIDGILKRVSSFLEDIGKSFDIPV